MDILKTLDGEILNTNSSGKIDFRTAIKDCDLIGIYFSAHWCPPCRNFTPKLSNLYKQWKENGKKIEIFFASSDKDQHSFEEYFRIKKFFFFQELLS